MRQYGLGQVLVVVLVVGVATGCVGGRDGIWVGDWEGQLSSLELKGKRIRREWMHESMEEVSRVEVLALPNIFSVTLLSFSSTKSSGAASSYTKISHTRFSR